MPKVSVVILNFNGSHHLKKFLPTLIRHTSGAEIIIADNASTDDSIQWLTRQFPSIKCLRLTKNHGFAGGYNEALKQIQSDYYILLNSDIEVTADWNRPLIDFLETNRDYAACQPKVLDFNQPNKFEHAGASGGFVDLLGYPFCRGRIFDCLEEDQGQYNDIIEIVWATGACLAIRADLFHRAGGFDADFFAHMEEIDLCWRLRAMKFKIAVVPLSTIYHVGGGTLSKEQAQKTYLNFRNNLSLLFKNLPISYLILILPIRLVLDFLGGISLWAKYSYRHFDAVLRAYSYTLIHLQSHLKKRKHPWAIPKELLGKKILAVHYFILNRTKYTEISNTR